MANKAQKKIVSFPRMGNISIPVKALLQTIGAQVYLPPENNRQTLSLGVKNSSESICLPYKLNLGNYIQALEAGANTLLMFQAPGTCRLGNYTRLAKSTLRELGYKFEMIVFDMYKGKLREISDKFALTAENPKIIDILRGIKLGFEKFEALDSIERELFYIRPREICPGNAEIVYKSGISLIDNAQSHKEIKQALQFCFEKYKDIEIDRNKYVPKIYLTGEFFVLLDPFANMGIEKELGYMGVEVHRQIMLSDWINNALKPKFIYKKESHRERSKRYAKTFLNRAIGGESLESIGDTVFAAKNNIDGVVHIGPFNCNPEIVSQNILPKISMSENIPVISIMMDEFTTKTGLITRLEAFVDLLFRKNDSRIYEKYR